MLVCWKLLRATPSCEEPSSPEHLRAPERRSGGRRKAPDDGGSSTKAKALQCD